MSHYSGTDHIQIHISKTVEQMLPILDDGALIGVFPNRSLLPFPPIPMRRECSRHQLHHPPHPLGIINMDHQVNMIACDAESVNRDAIAMDRHSQPFTIDLTITRELQQESPIMTPVRQVKGIPSPKISRSPGHSAQDSATH